MVVFGFIFLDELMERSYQEGKKSESVRSVDEDTDNIAVRWLVPELLVLH